MTRFSFHSSLVPGLAMLVLSGTPALTGCSHHDKPTAAQPVRVSVQVVGAGGSTEDASRRYSGTVESGSTSTVSFSAPGTIRDIAVGVGARVTRGQVLAHIKSESLENAHNIAAAELEEARDAYRRLKQLHDADALPDVKWVEVQAKLKQAENAEAMAARAVSDATITAPMSGYVSEKLADVGQTVIPAQPVLTIVDLGSMQVAISVPEEEIGMFVPGTTARVRVDAADTIDISGTMAHKELVADPFTRAYTVKFDLPNPGGHLLPGMTGDVTVDHPSAVGAAAPGVTMLPAQALLLSSDNRQFVWTISSGHALRRYVTADELSPGSTVRVSAGLQPGDSVIVAGMQKVSTGTPVQPLTIDNNR